MLALYGPTIRARSKLASVSDVLNCCPLSETNVVIGARTLNGVQRISTTNATKRNLIIVFSGTGSYRVKDIAYYQLFQAQIDGLNFHHSE